MTPYDRSPIYQRIADEIFFVRVPRIATYTEFDLEANTMTGIYDDKGNAIEKSHEELILVGWPLTKIAETAMDGMPIYIESRKDIKRLYLLAEEYVSGYRDVMMMANTLPEDGELYEKVYAFGKEMVDHQTQVIRGNRVSIQKAITSIGLIDSSMPMEAKQKFKKTHRVIDAQPLRLKL